MVKSYKDLKVWEKGMELVIESYRVSKLLPKSELFGLIAQIQRRPSRFLPILLKDMAGNTWAITYVTYQLPGVL